MDIITIIYSSYYNENNYEKETIDILNKDAKDIKNTINLNYSPDSKKTSSDKHHKSKKSEKNIKKHKSSKNKNLKNMENEEMVNVNNKIINNQDINNKIIDDNYQKDIISLYDNNKDLSLQTY